MKKRKSSPQQSSDLELILSSGLFDEDYYLAQNPDTVASGMEPGRHYLVRGAGEGRDPSPHFSSSGYVQRYKDVRFSGWNPLVHYLRAGRAEGRLADPLGDDCRVIRESGLFDEDYYRHESGADVPDDVDAVDHYVRHGAAQGLDPSEDFSTSAYVRLNPDVKDSGLSPLAHYVRYGRAGALDSTRGTPRRGSFHAQHAARWAEVAPWPVVRVPGVGPRVSVVAGETDGAATSEALESLLVLGILLANSLGASLRIVSRHRAPDASLVHRVERRDSVALLGDVELAHLPLGSTHPLLMGDREVVLVSGWRDIRAAMASALREEEIVRVVQDDERAAYADGDERLLCAETLQAPHGSPLVAGGRALLGLLEADFPHLADEAVAFEHAYPETRVPGERSGARPRTLLFLADPHDPRSLYWRGGEALCQALERNVVDPDVWDVVCVGAEPGLILTRDVRPTVLTWDEWLAGRPKVDAVLALRAGGPLPLEAMREAAAGVAVLTNADPLRPDPAGLTQNLLVCETGTETMVRALGRLTALGQDDEQRRRNREADHVEHDWEAATATAVAFLRERLHPRLHANPGSGRHVH